MRKILAMILATTTLGAYTPTNMNWPYDRTFTTQAWYKKLGSIGAAFEYMVSNRCYDPNEKQVAATQIYGENESSLSMLEGFEAGTEMNLLANRVRGMQDGTRGMFATRGKLEAWSFFLNGSFNLSMIKIPGDLTLNLSIPFQRRAMKDVTWTSLTKDLTVQDDMVRSVIGSNQEELSDFARTHAKLDLGDQERIGLGDIVAMLDWKCFFLHNHNRLKEVLVNLRAGVSIPTGHELDLDKAYDLSFGHDSTFAVPIGAGLQLGLSHNFAIGIDVGTTLLVRRSKEWRLKNGWAQTEHLLPKKGMATRDYGPEWKFKLYGRLTHALPGTAFLLGYQFHKMADSTLYEQDKTVSASLANRSASVDSNESHNGFVEVLWSPKEAHTWRVSPELSFGVKVPFNGKRMMSGATVSIAGSVRF